MSRGGSGAVRVTEAQLKRMIKQQRDRTKCGSAGLVCDRPTGQCTFHRPFTGGRAVEVTSAPAVEADVTPAQARDPFHEFLDQYA